MYKIRIIRGDYHRPNKTHKDYKVTENIIKIRKSFKNKQTLCPIMEIVMYLLFNNAF